MKLKKFSLAAILGAGLLVSGTQAFARDRDDDRRWDRGRDRYERRWDEHREHEREEWREHHRYYDRDYRYYGSPGYYNDPNYYVAPPPPVYYRPGISGSFYFGPRY